MSSFVFMRVFLSFPLHQFLLICLGQEVLFLLGCSFLRQTVQSAVCKQNMVFYLTYSIFLF